MAFESITTMTASDPTRVAGDLNEHVKPTLDGSGALAVMAAEILTGPMSGAYVLSTRWASMDAWSAAQVDMAANMAPGGPLADLAGLYQPLQRILMEDMIEAGNPDGPFIVGTRYSVTSPPEKLDHAADVLMSGGANGIRVLSVVAGGEMTGHIIGAIFLDSLDTSAGLAAAIQADAQYLKTMEAAGAQLQARTFHRRV